MQGKGFTKEQKESIIQSLQPYLEMGFSRNKACEFIGLTPQTLSNWVQADESLLMKLTAWENVVNTTVMANLIDAINKESETDDAKKETSKWWAERRMKKEFSPRTELTGEEGETLTVPVLVEIINEKPTENTNTEGTV